MKTGYYQYTDGSKSKALSKDKELAGIICNVTDSHMIVIAPFEGENLTYDEAQSFGKDKGYRCPTIDELTGIYLNKDKINASLEAAGLPKLKEWFYWSSTEYSTNLAWGLGMSVGYRDAANKNNTYQYVRPVLAL